MESHGRPPQIKLQHLERLAVTYARQSTEKQVVENEGSTADQRGQAEHARRWGWREELVQINDEDLGLSGTAGSNRPGFIRLNGQLAEGRVGIVLVSDLSRLSRDSVALFIFLNECARHDTLIAISGVIPDLVDPGQMLTQRVITSVVEFENMRRRDMMMRGKMAKLKEGKAVTVPPAGYRHVGNGKWELDPDPLVQGAIRAVFAEFLRCRSLIRTMRALREQGVRIPRRNKHGVLRWTDPVVHNIVNILHHPAYRGAYVFGRKRAGREGRP